jgi:hypothetical protein
MAVQCYSVVESSLLRVIIFETYTAFFALKTNSAIGLLCATKNRPIQNNTGLRYIKRVSIWGGKSKKIKKSKCVGCNQLYF